MIGNEDCSLSDLEDSDSDDTGVLDLEDSDSDDDDITTISASAECSPFLTNNSGSMN